MNDAQRFAEAKRLILLAMDQLSRVADANPAASATACQAEEMFADLEEKVRELDEIANDGV